MEEYVSVEEEPYVMLDGVRVTEQVGTAGSVQVMVTEPGEPALPDGAYTPYPSGPYPTPPAPPEPTTTGTVDPCVNAPVE